MMQGQRRPPQMGRPAGPPHGQMTPSIPFVAPRLWTMSAPRLSTYEPFVPDLQAPNGTDQEDKLSADMIEHGYRDTPVVRLYFDP